MDNMYCTGEEKNLTACRFDGWGANDCTSSEAAGVVCLSPEITATEETTTTPKPPKKEPFMRIKVYIYIFISMHVFQC
jgi:lysyl oxidase-like protein 2/3/4